MTIAHLVVCGFASLALGFVLGWWRGREQEIEGVDENLDAITNLLEKIPTHCACGAGLEPMCSGGCAVTIKVATPLACDVKS